MPKRIFRVFFGENGSTSTLGKVITGGSGLDIFDLLLNPGVFFGCLVGIGVAALVRWLFPIADLTFVQTLMIVLFTGIGSFVQFNSSGRTRNDR